jgi:hypothetical protein
MGGSGRDRIWTTIPTYIWKDKKLNRYAYRDSNRRPPKYKIEELPLQPTCLFSTLSNGIIIVNEKLVKLQVLSMSSNVHGLLWSKLPTFDWRDCWKILSLEHSPFSKIEPATPRIWNVLPITLGCLASHLIFSSLHLQESGKNKSYPWT